MRRRIERTSPVRARRMLTSIGGHDIAGLSGAGPGLRGERPCRRRDRPLSVRLAGPTLASMSLPRTIAFAAAAAVAVTATLGCGFLSAASNLAGNISTLSDFADKITKSETATFQATYQLQDGTPVTVAQKPPNASTVSAKGMFLATPDSFYLCDKSSGSWVCQKSPNNGSGTADPTVAAAMGGN